MEKKALLATILSLLVIFIWYTLFFPRFSPPVRELKTKVLPSEKGSFLPLEAKGKTESKEEEIVLNFGEKNLVFTTAGAGVKNWMLKEKNKIIELVLPNQEKNLFFATLPELKYQLLSKDTVKVIFQTVTPERILINKTYEFLADPYTGYLDFEITNLENLEKKFTLSLLTLGPGLGTDEKGMKDNLRHLRVLGYRNKLLEKFKFNQKVNQSYEGNWSWFGIDNLYFLAALFPETKIDSLAVEKDEQAKMPVIRVINDVSLPAKSKINFRFRFYLGPKKYSTLKQYGQGLEKTVNFGLFADLSKGAFYLMNWFYKITGNYGLAIIILTLIMQIILFPLTKKSFQASLSMKKMQPLINELKIKYKDDPKRFQSELFHLYRSKKSNPFGGCLPMLLQMPIFWALFTTLQNAYELRGAEFILWIKDLSHPDTLFRLGNIPVNVLPLLMGILMFFQQKLTTVATDPTQKQMMYLMPVMFTFIFWNFPSGLVLYWLTSSLFSSLGQFYLLKVAK